MSDSKETYLEYCQRAYKLFGLSSFSDPELPEVICTDAHTPQRFLALYAQSSESNLLNKLASNPNTPQDVLAGLAYHYETSVRVMTASNSRISVALSESLALDESCSVRHSVASNLSSSVEALRLLRTDLNRFVSKRANNTLDKLKTMSFPLSNTDQKEVQA